MTIQLEFEGLSDTQAVAKVVKTRKPRSTLSLSKERLREPVHEMRAYDSYALEDAGKTNDKPWVRPSSLEAPPPRPGFAQRWIRVAIRSEADPTNTSRKFREGWKPRPADTVPPSHQVPTIAHGKWAGTIGVEGSILCEMPKTMRAKRNAAVAQKTAKVTDAIEAELQAQSHPGMEITQIRKSTLVREVRPQVDADD